ncbi:acetamidase [Blastomyces dermatitidis ER-3]|uniref:amidase n=1 Tax=Ajellomyces dermatitidis (strain ER-3 / ATCC MYA-2586) TaxID=559297 RepID=A0ABP2ER00_AJEDR|nr:acetamidase [Blastomyces dermatitidis ER-3]EEQ84181.2 acetamidase [Blastomyces dermatitidis ER-3]
MPTLIDQNASWKEKSNAKKASVLNDVPSQFLHPELCFSDYDPNPVLDIPASLLSAKELEITALDATELVKAIAKGTYTAVRVLDAFTHRAVIAHRLLNCCLEFRYQDARAEAEQLDHYLRESGKTKGPLHGLPISVKDQCRIIGAETTCGFVSQIGVIDSENSTLVDVLADAGAVIFVKTSLSIGCLWGETINNIIGHTSNPFNRSFSCGGSSGGEGALLGMRGSSMGVGSDLAGSIRSPSAYQGLWGLRPSIGRIPYHRMLNAMEGNEIIESVVGPMSHSSKSLELFTKTVVDSQPWLHDPKCHPIPWRAGELDDILSGRSLRIGLMPWDDCVLPQPPIRRAMREIESKLKAAGHEVIPWKLDQKYALELLTTAITSDGRGDVDRTMAKSGEPGLGLSFRPGQKPLTILEAWELTMKRVDFRASVLEQWNATRKDASRLMDAYITAINPSVAFMHGEQKRTRYVAYTGTVNLLDFTACTIPVTFVDSDMDLPDHPEGNFDAAGQPIPSPRSDLDAAVRKNYEPGRYKGLPVAVQVVGRRLEEEKVLGIAQVLQKLLGS